ncbi:YlqD family protein [Falsibacillus pallidus]|uniref:YlqD protein n=1 Tax=Falsibacillus pallidus TaxID=493781 RepID=A0A370H0B2_9BACI|nr:YlqD family protein [Falsibacillus pallidus]RDI47483.1 YlqD protein [Falsibacillus pallidus]
MKIIQTALVKQVLTEKSKLLLESQYNEKKLQLEKECEQLRFELKKLEKTKKYSAAALKGRFEKEIQSRTDKLKVVEFQLDQLGILPLGSELIEKEIQSVIDINIGDNWEQVSKEKTILIEDGIIKDIR